MDTLGRPTFGSTFGSFDLWVARPLGRPLGRSAFGSPDLWVDLWVARPSGRPTFGSLGSGSPGLWAAQPLGPPTLGLPDLGLPKLGVLELGDAQPWVARHALNLNLMLGSAAIGAAFQTLNGISGADIGTTGTEVRLRGRQGGEKHLHEVRTLSYSPIAQMASLPKH
eukprot:366507-Chlamydomonas_euryale.AAC.7